MSFESAAQELFLKQTQYKILDVLSVKKIHDGFTNVSFLYTLKNKERFQVRIGNDKGTVYRVNERAILDVIQDTNFIYYDINTGNAIKKWIVGKSPNYFVFRSNWFLKKLAQKIKQLHQVDISGTKLIISHNYLCYLDRTQFFDDIHQNKFIELANKYRDLKQVLSHNDLSPANTLHNRKREVFFIDFEWGRINNEYWDLANFIRESNIPLFKAKKLCEYYGDIKWEVLKDFIYICTNFAYQWTFIMEQTPKIIKYRKVVRRRLIKYYERFYK